MSVLIVSQGVHQTGEISILNDIRPLVKFPMTQDNVMSFMNYKKKLCGFRKLFILNIIELKD